MKFSIRSGSKKINIPTPVVTRLCRIYNLLDELEQNGDKIISSKDIGNRLNIRSHNIRKDFSYLMEKGTTGSGYDISRLKSHISNILGFDQERKACVVGLDKLGMSIMNYVKLLSNPFKIVAGFDPSINRVETVKTDIPVYLTHEIPEIVNREGIEFALVTVPVKNVKETARRLVDGGIKGIINFSPTSLSIKNDNVFVRNIDLLGEFRILSAMHSLK
ncbi:redox-sensing transcriptional repressor Rex [Spirochaetota bacterium]